jgi:hypothetical protein
VQGIRTKNDRLCLAIAMTGCLAALACSESEERPLPQIECWSGVGNPSAGVVELGTGITEFEPLLDGQELELHEGPQGGFHFFLHARLQGLFPGELEDRATLPYTHFTAEFADGTEIGLLECASRLPYEVEGPGSHSLGGGRFLPIRDDSLDRLASEPLLASVAVLDCYGVYAEDRRWVRVQFSQRGTSRASRPIPATTPAVWTVLRTSRGN